MTTRQIQTSTIGALTETVPSVAPPTGGKKKKKKKLERGEIPTSPSNAADFVEELITVARRWDGVDGASFKTQRLAFLNLFFSARGIDGPTRNKLRAIAKAKQPEDGQRWCFNNATDILYGTNHNPSNGGRLDEEPYQVEVAPDGSVNMKLNGNGRRIKLKKGMILTLFADNGDGIKRVGILLFMGSPGSSSRVASQKQVFGYNLTDVLTERAKGDVQGPTNIWRSYVLGQINWQCFNPENGGFICAQEAWAVRNRIVHRAAIL